MWGSIASFVGNAMLQIAGSFGLQMLVGAGVAVVTYAGVNSTITYFKTNVIAAFALLPQEVVGMLSLMEVGSCVSMVFSAILMRITVSGMASGAKKFVKK